jgi:HEPN domain-containing protein
MKTISQGWLNAAVTDLLAIKKLEGELQLTGVVSFHAQQCIEKSFKAVLEQFNAPFHKVHDLLTLHKAAGIHINIPADIDILRTLNSLYIDSR